MTAIPQAAKTPRTSRQELYAVRFCYLYKETSLHLYIEYTPIMLKQAVSALHRAAIKTQLTFPLRLPRPSIASIS